MSAFRPFFHLARKKKEIAVLNRKITRDEKWLNDDNPKPSTFQSKQSLLGGSCLCLEGFKGKF